MGILLAAPAVVHAQPSDTQPPAAAVLALQETLANVIARVEPCVVAISRAPAGDQPQAVSPLQMLTPLPAALYDGANSEFTSSGVGVVIDPSGLILTQYLSIRPGERHLVTTTDGQLLPAVIKAADPRSGLAILQVKATKLTAIEIGNAEGLRKGHFIVTLGNPEAIIASGQATASWGSVTNLAQRATPSTNLNNTHSESGLDYATTLHHLGTLIQTDAKLNWTSNGGAVVDLSGKLVGITTHTGTLPGHESPAGYAIPMSAPIRRIVDVLKTGQEVEYGLLGLSLSGAAPPPAGSSQPSGALVSSVVRGSAAFTAGIRPGDRIAEIDSQPIRDVPDLQLIVSTLPPGKPVQVKYFRNGEAFDSSISLWKLYVPGEKVVTQGQRSWRGMKVDYSTALPQALLNRATMQALIDPEGCVAIVEVDPGSAADSAGIKPGMFVSHVAEQRVTTPDAFYKAVADADDTVYLQFTGSDGEPGEQVPANLNER
ncbi:Periplasmic pH-dependent serine endoprotease DegQ precursor [Aeoliella mucimassa]|uniref:Periplasmic pH-dependent serine endoprotease DegQ n=2 Tax=Aeoliella mucimassa TaxID=2527972 RepID=A0A518ANQ6_9BACT|nr:Periplasmic pH-dependent serine endoprotease DegQ precursor [Aeoliella mucimassa]